MTMDYLKHKTSDSLGGMNDNKPFKLAMNDEFFKKGDLITSGNGSLMRVLRVYRMNWFKRLLKRLRIKTSWFIGVKVKFFDEI